MINIRVGPFTFNFMGELGLQRKKNTIWFPKLREKKIVLFALSNIEDMPQNKNIQGKNIALPWNHMVPPLLQWTYFLVNNTFLRHLINLLSVYHDSISSLFWGIVGGTYGCSSPWSCTDGHMQSVLIRGGHWYMNE